MATDSTSYRIPAGNHIFPVILLFQDTIKGVIYA